MTSLAGLRSRRPLCQRNDHCSRNDRLSPAFDRAHRRRETKSSRRSRGLAYQLVNQMVTLDPAMVHATASLLGNDVAGAARERAQGRSSGRGTLRAVTHREGRRWHVDGMCTHCGGAVRFLLSSIDGVRRDQHSGSRGCLTDSNGGRAPYCFTINRNIFDGFFGPVEKGHGCA